MNKTEEVMFDLASKLAHIMTEYSGKIELINACRTLIAVSIALAEAQGRLDIARKALAEMVIKASMENDEQCQSSTSQAQ